MAEIEVRCSECDAVLEDAEFKKHGMYSASLFVNPCKKCIDDARAESYDHGQEDAAKKGAS